MNINEQMRLQRWAKDMADCQNSGLTQQQWCEMRGIKLKTFEKRCKCVRDVAESMIRPESSGTSCSEIIDGLATVVKERFRLDPFEKDILFLFCGRRADRLKGLLWEDDGFLLLYKRLESGNFQ